MSFDFNITNSTIVLDPNINLKIIKWIIIL